MRSVARNEGWACVIKQHRHAKEIGAPIRNSECVYQKYFPPLGPPLSASLVHLLFGAIANATYKKTYFLKIGSTSVSIVFQYKVRHFSAVLVHPLCGVTPIRERNSRGKLPAPSQTRNKLMWLLTEQVLLTQSTLPCKQDSAARRP